MVYVDHSGKGWYHYASKAFPYIGGIVNEKECCNAPRWRYYGRS